MWYVSFYRSKWKVASLYTPEETKHICTHTSSHSPCCRLRAKIIETCETWTRTLNIAAFLMPKASLAAVDWCWEGLFLGPRHRCLISGIAMNSLPFFIFWSHSSHLPRDRWKWEEHFHQTDEDHSRQRVQWSWQDRFHSAGVSEHRHSHPGSDRGHEDSTDRLHRRPEHSEGNDVLFNKTKLMCFVAKSWQKDSCLSVTDV